MNIYDYEWMVSSMIRSYNFEWVESTMLPASRLSTEFFNIDWVRGLQARIPTIMNEWCLPWSEVTSLNKWSQQWYQYKHSWRSEVTHILKSRILNEWSRQWSQHPDYLRNSIILTELADYRYEYLRLWMSDAFNDQNFTILNEWSQRCSQHPDSLRNSIILTELEDYSEYLRLWMNGVFHDQKLQFWMSGVNDAPSIQTLYGIL